MNRRGILDETKRGADLLARMARTLLVTFLHRSGARCQRAEFDGGGMATKLTGAVRLVRRPRRKYLAGSQADQRW